MFHSAACPPPVSRPPFYFSLKTDTMSTDIGGFLITYSFIPSTVLFIIGLVSSGIVSFYDSMDTCSNSISTFIYGSIAICYFFAFQVGYNLLGPVQSSVLNILIGFYAYYGVMFAWFIFGISTVASGRGTCVSKTLTQMFFFLIRLS